MEINKLINELCSTYGVSGCEEPALDVAKKYLDEFAETSVDRNGNLYAVLGNKNAEKTILLDAHIDRIGFMVTDINENGFVKIDKCGGIDARTLQDSVLVLQGENNISGVVCCLPPHLSDGKEDKATPISKIWVDFGMPYDEIIKFVKIGDVLTYKSYSENLLNNKIMSPALDNRSGVAALIKCAEFLSREETLKYKIVILLSSQEETFGTGAKTASFTVDADEAVVVDVSFASQPDVSGVYSKIKLSKGPMICVSPTLSKKMTEKLINMANSKSIPYQLEPISGVTGTNADHISVAKSGVKSAVISIPQKNMHTPVEIINIDDVENTATLIAEYIKCGGDFDD